MHRIKHLLLSLLIISGTVTFAQSKKTSEEILKEVSQKTKAYSTIRINFTYNMDNASAGVHESETGTLLVKGEQYRLDIAGQKVISDGKTAWTYIAEANEVQINAVEDDESVITPTRLLTAYSEDYKSKLTGEASRAGRAEYIIELKPNQDKNFTLVQLNIDKELVRINRIAIQDKSGNTFSYIVNKFETGIAVKDSDFTFNSRDYPGVEVIDMR